VCVVSINLNKFIDFDFIIVILAHYEFIDNWYCAVSHRIAEYVEGATKRFMAIV